MARSARGRTFEPLEKREVLYSPDADPATLAAHGAAYLEEGLICDALDFFEQAAHREGLEEVLRRALESADAFLIDRCLKALGRDLPAAEWKDLGDRAHSLGKEMYAYRCHLRAGLQASPPVIEPVTPPPRTRYEPPPPPETGAPPVADSSADY